MSIAPGLPADESPVNRNARTLLRQRGIPVKQVVRVNSDSILYVTPAGAPMTAWLHYTGTRLDLNYEPGFPAEPAGWVPTPAVLDRDKAREDLEDTDQDQA